MILSRRSLLKGIAAVIAAGPLATLTKAAEPKYGLHEIPINQIRDNPVALRAVCKKTVRQLAESIEKLELQWPIAVRHGKVGGYELIDGLHRLEAVKALGHTTIPAHIIGPPKYIEIVPSRPRT